MNKEPPALGTAPGMREKWNSRALFQLLWPLIVEQVLSVTVGIADTVMITVVGEHAVSGVIGIWYGMVTDWYVRTVFYVLRWGHGRWREKNVLRDR